MGAVACTMPAKTELAMEDVAQSCGNDEHKKERKVGIDMEKRGDRPIAARDEQCQQSAAQAEASNLPDQYESVFVFIHLFALVPASHLSQRL